MNPDLPLFEAREIDRLCDVFESMVQAGQSPKIEDFLEQMPASSRDKLLEALLPIDLELGEQSLSSRLPDYLRRFPSVVVLRVVSSLGFPVSEPTLDLSDSEAASNTAVDGQHRQHQLSDNDDSDVDSSDRSAAAREDSPAPDRDSISPAKVPARIGRYEILKTLGEGGFGCVYLARDSVLDREVALKVMGDKFLNDPLQISNLVREARTVAQLEGHPGLVAVRDVQFDGDFPYIVQEYIKGLPLDDWVTQQRPTLRRSIELFSKTVDAIGYAHQRDFVHRDLKPSNILIDAEGQPHIVDFGLALNVSTASLKRGEVAGTPSYMAPEQVRGESHRIDGRTDIWSLGIILYKMLTGRLPFQGKKFSELQQRITKVDPRPPRQLVPTLPDELERICLRCLEKLSSNRYGSTIELQEDLSSWLGQGDSTTWNPNETQIVHTSDPDSTRRNSDQEVGSQQSSSSSGSQPPVAVVPKGLRCFDEHDADFFLELLPGPRDRHGLPDSLRFWKQRLETNDSEQTFSVGLLYGPSGCGKSSLIRAGLIPRLSPEIDVIFVEATQDSTEERILRGLQAHYPRIPAETLTEQLAWLRDRKVSGQRKTVIIIDQLEQWLHGREIDFNQPLVQALRQCNGSQVQCLLMIRDDFWMAATRLMRELEIRLVEGENSAAVDLFSMKHARRVLQSFGMAFQAWPESEQPLTPEKKQFLDRAVEGLSEEGHVVCVRLTLFAEMMKQRPWTSETLKQVGGVLGIGVTFLEETFSSRNAPPEYRRHQQAARRLLQALLPQSGENIKGHMRTSRELMQSSGYESQPREFQRLVEILNEELRMITPTDPESQVANSDDVEETPDLAHRYYQLTHDYLVPSLRDWLTRKQRETRKGRAELGLAERSKLWNARPENRLLPSTLEWLRIHVFTNRANWTEPQRKMMRRTALVKGTFWLLIVFTLTLSGAAIQRRLADLEKQAVRENALVALDSLQGAEGKAVPLALQNLKRFPTDFVVAELHSRHSESSGRQKLSLSYGLAHFDDADIGDLLDELVNPGTDPEEAENIFAALKTNAAQSLGKIRDAAKVANQRSEWRIKSRLAIACLHLGDSSLASEMLRDRPEPLPLQVELPDLLSEFRRRIEIVSPPPDERLVSPATLFQQAEAYYFLDQNSESLKILQQSIVGDPKLLKKWLLLQAICESRAGQVDAVSKTLSRLSSMANHSEEMSFAQVLIPGWQGNVEGAIQHLRKLIDDEGDDSQTQFQMACIASQLARVSKEKSPRLSGQLTQLANQLLRSYCYDLPRPEAAAQVIMRDPHFIPMHEDEDFLQLLAELSPPKNLFDPVQRTNFVREFSAWSGPLAPLASQVQDTEDEALRSGICLSLGRISRPNDSAKELWVPVLRKWARSSLDGGTHSSALWTLSQWQLAPPEIRTSTEMPSTQNWWHAPHGLRFIKIQGMTIDHTQRTTPVGGTFWLCESEISLDLFEQFINDSSYSGIKPFLWSIPGREDAEAKMSDLPAGRISWYDAVMFCNWLSWKLKLKPCYEIEPESPAGLQPDGNAAPRRQNTLNETFRVTWNHAADGIRLPTSAEWEYACRAATTTRFSSGDDENDLVDYAWIDVNTNSHFHPRRTKACNAWGLFDMHGNASEWCWDLDLARDSVRVNRGGSWGSTSRACESRNFGGYTATLRSEPFGFRIAMGPSVPTSAAK